MYGGRLLRKVHGVTGSGMLEGKLDEKYWQVFGWQDMSGGVIRELSEVDVRYDAECCLEECKR